MTGGLHVAFCISSPRNQPEGKQPPDPSGGCLLLRGPCSNGRAENPFAAEPFLFGNEDDRTRGLT